MVLPSYHLYEMQGPFELRFVEVGSLLTDFFTHDGLTSAIIIDDDRDTVEVFVDYMEMLNVNVLARGYCGKDAVDLYERYRPNLVFLDLMMADYDGFYALERIRKINSDAIVIVVTADLRSDSELRLSALKPTQVLFKPFAPELLEEIVKRYKSE